MKKDTLAAMILIAAGVFIIGMIALTVMPTLDTEVIRW